MKFHLKNVYVSFDTKFKKMNFGTLKDSKNFLVFNVQRFNAEYFICLY